MNQTVWTKRETFFNIGDVVYLDGRKGEVTRVGGQISSSQIQVTWAGGLKQSAPLSEWLASLEVKG